MHIPALSPEQNQAVRESLAHASSMILSGPGSGKTRVMTHRLAYLVNTLHVPPESILAVTFTNQAAREMRRRISSLVSSSSLAQRLWVSTFHSTGSRILRQYGHCLGYSPSYSIFDESDATSLLKRLTNDLHEDPKTFPRKCYVRIQEYKEQLILPDDAIAMAPDELEQLYAKVYQDYQDQLHRRNAMDFADLQMQAIRVLQQNPSIREQYQQRFQYLMVDEFQDINYAQLLFLQLLRAEDSNLCVVGDIDQSIYAFRGSNPMFAVQFQEIFPDAHISRLEECYRCTGSIVTAANSVIRHNEQRLDKTIRTDRDIGFPVVWKESDNDYDEADYIAEVVHHLHFQHRIPLDEIGILYRTNRQVHKIQHALVQQRLPFHVVGSSSFWASREIRDMIGILQVLAGDESSRGYRLWFSLMPGVGPKSLDQVEDLMEENNLSWLEAIAAFEPRQKRTKEGFVKGHELLRVMQEALDTQPLSALLAEWVKVTAYIQSLPLEEHEITKRRANLTFFFEQLDDLAKEDMLNVGIRYVLDQLLLAGGQDEADRGISCMTVHASKGLEFRVVLLAGCEEGLLPHAQALIGSSLEEERRLFYVAVTRAKDLAILTTARTRETFGRKERTIPSRFISEIPSSIIEYCSPDEDPEFELMKESVAL